MRYKKEKVFSHLTEYKSDVLKVVQCGYWVKNKIFYQHILPNEEYHKNIIINGFGDNLIKRIFSDGFKKHTGFHHLNSSQALAFNLFSPLIEINKLELILKQIGIVDVVNSSKFEHIENKEEYTNFDFYIRGTVRKYFFEVKYTEDNFASTSDDKSHQEKYEKIYKNDLNKISDITREYFFKKYQLWRNLLYCKNNDVVIFVLPRFRIDLINKIEVEMKLLKNDKQVKVLFMDDICSLFSSSDDVRLKNHYNEFKRKYLDVNFN